MRMKPGCFNLGSHPSPHSPGEAALGFPSVSHRLEGEGGEGLFPVEAVRTVGSQERCTWLGWLPGRALRTIWMHQVEIFSLESGAKWW